MKAPLLATLLAAPLLASPTVRLAFAPEAGGTLTTTAERVLELELVGTEIKVIVDGEENEHPPGPEMEMSMKETESVSFTDVYAKVDAGRVVELSRTFLELSTISANRIVDPDGEEYADETPGTSELEGAKVWFRWDEENGEYGARFDEESEDRGDELLEDLEAVADLTWFLPDEEVEEGDRWEIDVEAFRQLSSLSGDLKVHSEDDEGADEFGEQFDDNLEGELEGKLVELRGEGDERVAVIELVAKLHTEVEIEGEDTTEEMEGASTDRWEFSFELEGELLWDLAAGRARHLDLAGEVETTMATRREFSGDGHELCFETKHRFEGEVTYAVEVE